MKPARVLSIVYLLLVAARLRAQRDASVDRPRAALQPLEQDS